MGDEYYLQHPKDQLFYKYIALVMGYFAMNTEAWHWYTPPASKLYQLQRWIVIIFVPITCFSQILYLYLNYKDHSFFSLASMLAIVPVGFVVLIKSLVSQTPSYKKAMTALMGRVHLHNFAGKDYSDDKNKFVNEKIVLAEKYTRRTFFFLMTFVFICFSSWNVVPMIHNVRNNESINNITVRLEVLVHFWQPFDYEFNFYGYLFILIVGFYTGLVAVILMVLFDTINLSYVYHLVGHIEIIKYDLRTAFKDENMDQDILKHKLVEITKYYGFILDTFVITEAAFGLNVASIYAQNLVQGGLMLYMLMTSGRDLEIIFTFGLMIPIFMGILIVISLVLENIRIQADDIPTLVYDIPWESMSISNQKIMLSILFQVQPTLEFKAAFNIKTGVQPAINIIKTTFSYYVMIKSSKEM